MAQGSSSSRIDIFYYENYDIRQQAQDCNGVDICLDTVE